ncbi:MAG: histidine ammonia-lyase [Alphaproteobacteria bacterium]|nr:histidine ammonia-lyase [Alphaproteobacteria bacterium]
MIDLMLDGSPLDPSILRDAARGQVRIRMSPEARMAIESSARAVAAIVDSGKTTYGVNTGFGLLARKTIPVDHLDELQCNLVMSHAAGVGAPMDDTVVRLMILLKVVALARGYSGVRTDVVDALVRLVERQVHPVIPEKGSVGASGDLAPLAHLSAVLMGLGEARVGGRVLPARDALNVAGLSPLAYRPKEALALLNGTQASTAFALDALFAAEDVFAAAMVAGALSVDAAQGSDTPFDARIHALRGQPGQIDVARHYRTLLAGSAIRASHLHCDRVQDPYSLRCQPQVMGACLDMMRQASRTLVIEANAVTDNPLIFTDTVEALSGGNFHAEPVAMAADSLALAIAEIGALSERRIALLIDPGMSKLPAFLVPDSGLNSGFMIAQVTAAALASENKSLAHPACVDSLPTSANQEDHVSMAAFAARRLRDMVFNTGNIVAIELLAAAQGVEFRKPLETSPVLREAMAMIRAEVPSLERDRLFAPDIQKLHRLVSAGHFRRFVSELFP